ncbi:AAA family ATPase [bacterium]|nr:AAA family ATPase [bacterium]
MNINQIIELDQLARKDVEKYHKKRTPYFKQIRSSFGKHFVGITGPRGVGKTVLLKQLAYELESSIYISIDALEEMDLFETCKTLTTKYKIKYFLLDEIHFYRNFERDLKKIFDFLDVHLIFTSSVALAIVDSEYDLSRRVQKFNLYPFSFREYLYFKIDVDLPVLTISQILNKEWSSEHVKYAYLFKDYIQGGLHPFSLEEPDILPLLKNILNKIIQRDIPSVARLQVDELEKINKVVQFIGRSEVGDINYSTISSNVKITKYKAEQYIDLLKKSYVLNPLFPCGTNVLKEPKVLMYLPYRLLYKEYNDAVGALREDFCVEMIKMKMTDVHYLKSTRGAKTPDFLIKTKEGDIVLEVGGKGKGRSQFKGIGVDKKIRFLDSDETRGDVRPLHLLGYLV